MKRIVALSVALLLTLLMAAPVTAAKPDYVYGDDVTWGPVVADWVACPFEVMAEGEGTWTKRLWVDDTDFPVKARVDYRGTMSYYDPQYPDRALAGWDRWTKHESNFRMKDPTTMAWDQRNTGVFVHVVVPGKGLAWHTVGPLWFYAEWPDDEPEPTETLLREDYRTDIFKQGKFCGALTP